MKIKIYPKNKEHFKELIPFAKKILLLLKKNRIKSVIYSSYAVFYHTKDSNLKVSDIDVLIEKKTFPKVMGILRKNKIKFKFLSEWDTIIIKKGKLKVDIDWIGKGYKDIKEGYLPNKTVNMNFYGFSSKLMMMQDLYNTYVRGYNLTKEDKVKLSKKIKYLEKFLGRKLK